MILNFFIATALIALVFLIPSFVISMAREHEIKSQIKAAQGDLGGQSLESILDVLKDTNDKILVLKPTSDIFITKLFSSVTSHLAQDIKINRLVISKKVLPISMVIYGVAGNRASLVSFVGRLKTDPNFSDAILPVSNLASGSNIDFSITLPLK